MTVVYDDIRNALETQLSGISGVPPIAWENVSYTPTTSTTFLRPSFAPLVRRPSHRGLNPQQYYAGAFFIDVVSPEGEGPGAGLTIAQTLVENFESTSTLTANSLDICIREAMIERAYTQDAWFITPVVIDWYTYN